MVAQLKPQIMSPQEYLEWEEQQPIKYEYINGEVFAMTGGILPHNSIALNLENGPFHYPDVMVSCDPRDRKARKVIYHPCLIVEVLSPGTEGFDRGKKFRHYRQIESLQEYVLIEADSMNVECYRINEKGKWELTVYALDSITDSATEIEVDFTSVDFRCPIALLYEDVVFPEDNPEDSTEVIGN